MNLETLALKMFFDCESSIFSFSLFFILVTRPGISAVPGEGTALETPSTAPNVSVPQGPFTTPSIISSTPRNGTEELYPTPSSLPLTSAGGGGGSWNTETLFPTPPPHVVPER